MLNSLKFKVFFPTLTKLSSINTNDNIFKLELGSLTIILSLVKLIFEISTVKEEKEEKKNKKPLQLRQIHLAIGGMNSHTIPISRT